MEERKKKTGRKEGVNAEDVGRQQAKKAGKNSEAVKNSCGEEGARSAYEKTVLYLYPHLHAMARAMETVVNTQARLSYRGQESAEALVERLLTYEYQTRFLLQTERDIEGILQIFSREELFVLEYRYFRRKRRLLAFEKDPVEISLRTFYRRQHSVLKKFSAAMKCRGMDERWFLSHFSAMDWAMKVYKKVREGRDAAILGKHKTRPLPFRDGATKR